MKKYLCLSMVALVGFACNSDEANTDVNARIQAGIDSAMALLDTAAKVTEPVVEVAKFTHFEDYVTIKTMAEITEYFGEENLKTDTAWYAEGTVMMLRTTGTDPHNGNKIAYVWDEEDASKLSHLEVMAKIYNRSFGIEGAQTVHSTTGLFTGMTLKEFAEWNGAPIKFSGFGWDFGGSIMTNEDSKISKSGLRISLNVEYKEGEDHDGIYGDIELTSDDAVVQNAPIYIEMLSLWAD